MTDMSDNATIADAVTSVFMIPDVDVWALPWRSVENPPEGAANWHGVGLLLLTLYQGIRMGKYIANLDFEEGYRSWKGFWCLEEHPGLPEYSYDTSQILGWFPLPVARLVSTVAETGANAEKEGGCDD